MAFDLFCAVCVFDSCLVSVLTNLSCHYQPTSHLISYQLSYESSNRTKACYTSSVLPSATSHLRTAEDAEHRLPACRLFFYSHRGGMDRM